LGCRRFRNYKHILQTSLDGHWIDGGEFPMALGSYATIPKAKRGGAIDRANSRFLDIVHMDIAFGDCVSVGGFRYSLILVNRATRYNWVYGLKDISADSILLALRNFKADAGSYARCFRLDCDVKCLASAFGTTSSTTIQESSLLRLVANRLTGWSNRIGRQWCICPVLISLKNKCLVPSGFSPSSTRHV
jgi:hypothetical protein